MTNQANPDSRYPNQDSHSSFRIEESIPPDLRRQFDQIIREAVRVENEALLARHAELKPLMNVKDVARTLKCSVRTVETFIAEGELRPLWIKGQRRFHPDTIAAFIRAREVKR